MQITIIKRDLLVAIKHNKKGNWFIEYDPKTGKSRIIDDKSNKEHGWELLPIPIQKDENTITRWTPKKFRQWLEKKGFLVNVQFNYDGIFSAPLRRFGEPKTITPNSTSSKPDEKKNKKGENVSPFPCAVVLNNLVLASGQLPLNPESHKLVYGSIEDEISMCFKNLEFSLQQTGSALNKVIKIVAYVTDIKAYKYFEDWWDDLFPANPPAFSCVQVEKLPYDVKVTLDVVAYV